MKQTCILILGMHRSGTSALSGTLNLLDVYLGNDLISGGQANPKGYFENSQIFKINEKLLSQARSDVHDDFYNPKKLKNIKEFDLKELKNILIDQFKDSQLFAIKDPRIGYLLPLYTQALEDIGVEVKIIIPFRNPLEVARSLSKRNRFSIEKSLLHWAYHILTAELFSRGLPRVFTHFDELVESPEVVINKIDKSLKLNLLSKFEFKKEQIKNFLTPDLKHHNIELDNFSEELPKPIRDILTLVPKLNEAELEENFDEIRQKLFDNQSLFYNDDIQKSIQKLEQVKQGLQAKDKELEQVKQGLLAKDNELKQAEKLILALRSSFSWRLTRPFRVLSAGSKWGIRNLRRLFRFVWWLCTGNFHRAAKALIPYYHKVVPASIKVRIPNFLRKPLRKYIYVNNTKHKISELTLSKAQLQKCKRQFTYKNLDWDGEAHTKLILALESQTYRCAGEKVSIIMPTFNRAQKVSAAITSVLSQTHSNFELIVIDDHSTDNTEKIVSDFTDPRIIYTENRYTKGVSGARNTGLDTATGNWVFFLDSDNTWKEQMIEFMLKHAEAAQTSAGYCAANVHDDNHKTKFILYADFDFESCLRNNFVDMNCFFMRWTDQFRSYRFDESLKRLVDWDLILRVAVRTRLIGIPFIGVDYYDGNVERITNTEHVAKGEVQQLQERVRDKIRPESVKDNSILDYSPFRVAVHLHIYHSYAVPECIEYIQNIHFDFDLFVSTSLAKEHECLKLLRKHYPFARIYLYPNVGSDIGPFFELLSTFKNYPLILKIHTKRNYLHWGNTWRKALLKPILGSPELVNKILERFRENEHLVMSCSADLYKPGMQKSIPASLKELETIAKQVGLKKYLFNNWSFVAGTMFWVRPKVYLQLARYMCDSNGYSGQFMHDGSIEHGLERALGLALWQDKDNQVALNSMDGEINEVSIGSGASWESVSKTIARLSGESITSISNQQSIMRTESPFGSDELPSVGYILWDWPSLSQTFVLTEIRSLLAAGLDVKVYYHVLADQTATLDFAVDAKQYSNVDELAGLCEIDQRNCLHSPFVYPAATLMAWPVAERLGLPFTLMAGGVDVAHYENIKRNRVGEMTSSPLCLGVITLGSFHRDLLLECGVPSNKLILERQSVELPAVSFQRRRVRNRRVLCVGRFIEKKGIEYLIRAAAHIPDAEFILHGYGPLQSNYEQLIAELGITNFAIKAPLNGKDQLFEAYGAAEVFALPCVRAANGDLDGLPTVLIEAMALGLPVVTNDIANIPDLVIDGATGYLCKPGDIDSLVDSLRRALDCSNAEATALSDLAKRRAHSYAGSGRTMDVLLSRWSRRSIDIFMVTFDAPGYENIADTIEIINRIYQYTVMDFNIYVVDNASSQTFKDNIWQEFDHHPNFHFIELDSNLFCGPASNIAISAGLAEYAIYICSKEGFILQHGWELNMVRAMDAEPEAGLGGYMVNLPRFRKRGQLVNYPSFGTWRAPEFAVEEPDAPFKHVQGGIFILRRSVYDTHGGFSETVVHNGMDVEYSYYLQSRGCKLIDIAGVVAVTVKTVPPLRSLVDEHTFAVHPSSVQEVPVLDGIVNRLHKHCNLCGWYGPDMNGDHDRDICPSCASTSFDRTAYRVLSQSGILQTRPRIFGWVYSDALSRALSVVCSQLSLRQPELKPSLADTLREVNSDELIIADHVNWQDLPEASAEVAAYIAQHISNGGGLLLADAEGDFMREVVERTSKLVPRVAHVALASTPLRFDKRLVHFFHDVPFKADLQGLGS